MLDRHIGPDPRLPGHGLGFFEMSIHGVSIVVHRGNTGWFHNILALFPEHDLGILVSFKPQRLDGPPGPSGDGEWAPGGRGSGRRPP
jgi:hypothetical protein